MLRACFVIDLIETADGPRICEFGGFNSSHDIYRAATGASLLPRLFGDIVDAIAQTGPAPGCLIGHNMQLDERNYPVHSFCELWPDPGLKAVEEPDTINRATPVFAFGYPYAAAGYAALKKKGFLNVVNAPALELCLHNKAGLYHLGRPLLDPVLPKQVSCVIGDDPDASYKRIIDTVGVRDCYMFKRPDGGKGYGVMSVSLNGLMDRLVDIRDLSIFRGTPTIIVQEKLQPLPIMLGEETFFPTIRLWCSVVDGPDGCPYPVVHTGYYKLSQYKSNISDAAFTTGWACNNDTDIVRKLILDDDKSHDLWRAMAEYILPLIDGLSGVAVADLVTALLRSDDVSARFLALDWIGAMPGGGGLGGADVTEALCRELEHAMADTSPMKPYLMTSGGQRLAINIDRHFLNLGVDLYRPGRNDHVIGPMRFSRPPFMRTRPVPPS